MCSGCSYKINMVIIWQAIQIHAEKSKYVNINLFCNNIDLDW